MFSFAKETITQSKRQIAFFDSHAAIARLAFGLQLISTM